MKSLMTLNSICKEVGGQVKMSKNKVPFLVIKIGRVSQAVYYQKSSGTFKLCTPWPATKEEQRHTYFKNKELLINHLKERKVNGRSCKVFTKQTQENYCLSR